MVGLKSYLPKLEALTGLTAEMLYERQRALVRAGLLEAVPGRGPGSGVRVDATSLSIFLISLLAHELLVEVFMTEAIGRMESLDGECPFTGEKYFKDALKAILDNPKRATRTGLVIVNRNDQTGFIEHLGRRRGRLVISRPILRSKFANKGLMKGVPLGPSGMETIKSLRTNLIVQVADDIAALKKEAS